MTKKMLVEEMRRKERFALHENLHISHKYTKHSYFLLAFIRETDRYLKYLIIKSSY